MTSSGNIGNSHIIIYPVPLVSKETGGIFAFSVTLTRGSLSLILDVLTLDPPWTT